MRRLSSVVLVLVGAFVAGVAAQQTPSATGPYKVLKAAKVGGEGGWDYIFADVDGRRLYIPRGQTREVAATATSPAVPAFAARIAVYNLDTLAPEGEVPLTGLTGANGAAVCAKTGHGFASGHPAIAMFDTKTLQLIKTIDVPQSTPAFGPDGIYCDSFNDHTYIFSHPTKSAFVLDSKDGSVVGTVDLGGTPEQGVGDGKGTLYVVMQAESNIAVVDAKTLKTTKHFDFAEKGGRCNGLALDVKNSILFIACGNNSMTAPPQGTPATPTMVIMSAKDGKILTTLPLAGGSDGAQFNPQTMEAFSTHGNGTLTVVKETSPTTFEVEENLTTMNGARTIAFDSKTGHIFAMAQEFGPAPPPPTTPPPAGQRGGGRPPAIPGSFTILMIGK